MTPIAGGASAGSLGGGGGGGGLSGAGAVEQAAKARVNKRTGRWGRLFILYGLMEKQNCLMFQIS